MNKHFFLGAVLLGGLPLGAISQQAAITGIWTLTDKQHLQGPLYGNGIPKLYTITEEAGNTNLAMTTTVGEKDTVELESFGPINGHSLAFRTAKGRQKVIQLIKLQHQNLWIRYVNMSARNNANQQEIQIVDSLQLSEDGNYLTLTRHYDGPNTPDGNEDYVMAGTYKKTTSEQLALKTTMGKGVLWTAGLTWQQILAKARQEKKYVFVDCYATWCGPCKIMDQEVFPLNWVGEAMNHQFLAVKVQMDTGKNDPENIRLTYSIARHLEQKYNIQVLPSYLFFDGTGQLVHKEMGAFKTDEFVNILHKAASPSSQLYTQYREALAENLPAGDLPALAARLAEPQYGEQEMSKTLIRLYIERQFYPLSDKALLTRDKLEAILQYWGVIKSNDRIFKLFHSDPDKINKILGKKNEDDFAQQRIEDTIWQEEVRPAIKKANSMNIMPDWNALQTTITHKYGRNYAARPILDTKVWWYQKHQQWSFFCKYLYQQMHANKNLDSNTLNSAAWMMFLYSTEKEQLAAALQWTQQAINLELIQQIEGAPMIATCSTYGNLLYKLGRKEEAIAYYQKMVVSRAPVEARIWPNTLLRMQEGQPTWKNREEWTNL